MVGEGLMQIVAFGAQDVFLTGPPNITYFKFANYPQPKPNCLISVHHSIIPDTVPMELHQMIWTAYHTQVVVPELKKLIDDCSHGRKCESVKSHPDNSCWKRLIHYLKR